MLRKLRSSDLLSPDFPKRIGYTHAELAALPEDAMRGVVASGIAATARATNYRELEDIVRELGQDRYEPAVPTLTALWTECALVPVRVASGHALRAIGSPGARAALQALIDDHDSPSTFLAVQAIFDDDRTTAFDRCAPYFRHELLLQPGGAVIPREIVEAFCPWSFTYPNGVEVPQWRAPWVPELLVNDRRWLDLCIRLRHDSSLGDVARNALRYADREIVNTALEAVVRNAPPRIVAPSTKPVGDLAARYVRGEHDEVWRELRAYAAIAGDLREEALAVARETMRRVARAADLIAERLAARGWTAHSGTLRTAPSPEDRVMSNRIATFTGEPLPVSLDAFWETVGGIDFVWNYDGDATPPGLGVDLDMTEMDPLAVHPPATADWQLEEWEDGRSGVHPELLGPHHLSLAPDHLHKANISGGPPYGVELPFRGADPIFVNEAHGLPFVDYLRLCFRWGGFPRLERHADRADVRACVARLCDGIEPF